MCERLQQIYLEREIEASQLRTFIRPVYRELFELLSGRSTDEKLQGKLRDVPLLTELDGEYRFVSAHGVLYARTPGFRERSGVDSQIPSFVLEAEPSATSPLTRLFGVGIIEESLDWHPDPGECPLDVDELAAFRAGMQALVPELLARMRAERTDNRDRVILEQFASQVATHRFLGNQLHLQWQGAESRWRPRVLRRWVVGRSRPAGICSVGGSRLATGSRRSTAPCHGTRRRDRRESRRDLSRLPPKRPRPTPAPTRHRRCDRLLERD